MADARDPRVVDIVTSGELLVAGTFAAPIPACDYGTEAPYVHRDQTPIAALFRDQANASSVPRTAGNTHSRSMIPADISDFSGAGAKSPPGGQSAVSRRKRFRRSGLPREIAQRPGEISDRRRSLVRRVKLLPFHQLGRYLWKEVACPGQLERTNSPTAEALETVCDPFRAGGLTAYCSRARTTIPEHRRAHAPAHLGGTDDIGRVNAILRRPSRARRAP